MTGRQFQAPAPTTPSPKVGVPETGRAIVYEDVALDMQSILGQGDSQKMQDIYNWIRDEIKDKEIGEFMSHLMSMKQQPGISPMHTDLVGSLWTHLKIKRMIRNG